MCVVNLLYSNMAVGMYMCCYTATLQCECVLLYSDTAVRNTFVCRDYTDCYPFLYTVTVCVVSSRCHSCRLWYRSGHLTFHVVQPLLWPPLPVYRLSHHHTKIGSIATHGKTRKQVYVRSMKFLYAQTITYDKQLVDSVHTYTYHPLLLNELQMHAYLTNQPTQSSCTWIASL